MLNDIFPKVVPLMRYSGKTC